jgi:hypothetical protein
VAGSSSGQPTPASGSRSRIRFSDEGSSGPEISTLPSRAEGGSPLLQKSTQASRGSTTSSKLGSYGRRRVRSLGAKSLLSDPSAFGAFPAKRSMDIARVHAVEKDPFGLGIDPAMDVFGPGILSDEYDLCESPQAYPVLLPSCLCLFVQLMRAS